MSRLSLLVAMVTFASFPLCQDAGASDFRHHGASLLSLKSLKETLGSPKNGTAGSDEEGVLRLRSQGNARFSLRSPITPHTEYLFRAKVRSNDQFVCRIGGLSMAYHALGEWQVVSGLYRNNDATEAEISLALAPLEKRPGAEVEIAEISMTRVERPEAPRRRSFSSATLLVEQGEATGAIIIPSEPMLYRQLAEKIAAAIEAKTGARLPIVTDREATEANYPILLPQHRASPLLLLGRLGNNRAFWAPYNRFLTAVDGFYPGGDGYTVHTAANVFHQNVNHLIIGGTSDNGVRRGVEAFLQKLTALPEGERLEVPWLLDVDLQGECRDFFTKENARWEETPENPLLPKPEPGYGNVVRWYQNAMGYYWTGEESFRKRAERALEQVLREKSITHHYIVEFLIRTYEMVHLSPLVTPEQEKGMEALITSNFLDFMTVSDLSWMTTFAPPYGQIGLVNRHQIAPWISDLKMAEWIGDILQPEGSLKELVDFRRSEKEAAFRNFVANRSGPSLPGGVADEAYDEINATFFRFALEKELYDSFFGSGNAHKALALERVNARTGQLAFPGGNRDSRLALGIMSCLTGDPELKWLWTNLPESIHARGYFQGRYLGQVRRYTPDASAPEAVPRQWNGLRFGPNPVNNSPVQANEREFYFASYRSGFSPEDDYVAFNGVSYTAPSGIVPLLMSHGVSWLTNGSEGTGRFNLNSATASRIDEAEQKRDSRRSDELTRCLWSAETPCGTAMRLRQMLSREIQWTRDFIVLGRGRFLFRDEFKAFKPGRYALNVCWQPAGSGDLRGNTASFITKGGKMEMSFLGDGFAPQLTIEGGARRLVNQAVRALEAGESLSCITVIQTAPSHSEPLATVRGGALEVTLEEGVKQTRLAWEGAPWPNGLCQAALVIDTGAEVALFQCKKVELPGAPSLAFEHPKHVALSSLGVTTVPPEAVPSSNDAASSRLLSAALRQGWPAPTVSTSPQPEAASAFTAQPAPWSRLWSFDRLQRPALVTSLSSVTPDIIDLGETVELAEIRAVWRGSAWTPAPLPESIQLAPEKVDGKFQWAPAVGKRQWRPGIRTANYGEAHPATESDETLLLDGVAARYIKAEPPLPLAFFTRSRMEGRHPLRVKTGDFLRNGTVQTLVISDVFPQFPRPFREDDRSVALLDADGKALFQLDLVGPVQSIRLLDRHGKGQKELCILYGNGTVEFYDLNGTLKASADLYKMHVEFDRSFGKGNTRAPAGGYVLPFSIGTWRPDASGLRRLVVGRYGGFTFLKPDLSFEGLLAVSGYATPGILENGVDFGSGSEEQVVAERLRFWHLGGEETPRVRDAHGHQSWPQAYDLLKTVPEDESSKTPLSGLPILRFEVLKGVTQEPRFLLLARGTTLSIYDGASKKVVYSWTSAAPMRAVAITRQAPDKLELHVATADSLLWRLSWDEGVASTPGIEASPFPDVIHALHEAGGDSLLIAGEKGLYVAHSRGKTWRIAEGGFHSIAPALTQPNGLPLRVVAATASGEVVCFQNQNPLTLKKP